MKTPVKLKEAVGKTIVRTLEVACGYLLFFSDDTYLSVYAVTGIDTEISDEPVPYDKETQQELGIR